MSQTPPEAESFRTPSLTHDAQAISGRHADYILARSLFEPGTKKRGINTEWGRTCARNSTELQFLSAVSARLGL